jgi:ribonuclease P protein component
VNTEQSSALQAGFTVSTRYFKRAVDRNRIRRLMREAYRLQKNDLKKSVEEKEIRLALFFIFTGSALPDYVTVYEKTGKLLARISESL